MKDGTGRKLAACNTWCGAVWVGAVHRSAVAQYSSAEHCLMQYDRSQRCLAQCKAALWAVARLATTQFSLRLSLRWFSGLGFLRLIGTWAQQCGRQGLKVNGLLTGFVLSDNQLYHDGSGAGGRSPEGQRGADQTVKKRAEEGKWGS